MKIYRCLMAAMLGLLTLAACGGNAVELEQTYTSEDERVTFGYPENWVLEVQGE